jgi:hypothetical protein
MKPEYLRRHVVSFKTSDLVLNFLRETSEEECETMSSQIHLSLDKLRRKAGKQKGERK